MKIEHDFYDEDINGFALDSHQIIAISVTTGPSLGFVEGNFLLNKQDVIALAKAIGITAEDLR